MTEVVLATAVWRKRVGEEEAILAGAKLFKWEGKEEPSTFAELPPPPQPVLLANQRLALPKYQSAFTGVGLSSRNGGSCVGGGGGGDVPGHPVLAVREKMVADTHEK
mmetsp:Transcript_71044/g.104125  ORF Transcript_71044/g.104125 Transcript_71044/m.104125 type:complete len:107 (+) Transcript_71044:54-374(+)|eukprot:CAMPEP_0179436078 /NCGR_PEP_ID=MMETSP0799-20121207/20094_1 /TAXON_ID=46947 /ORGANISM="Geminigera cryophila, Strain CCMP2564" /LENGTH=106 /DNA_ID=CAMNT_0021215901 /DNA_START=50 /DNA_END=370 /DNA_ORIENTATION=-